MGPILIYALFLAACGAAATRSSHDREDGSVSDGHAAEGEGKADMEPDTLPPREGINERWASFDDCILSDLVVADEKLYALCKGDANRLVRCPLDQGLQTTACENFVTFDQRPVVDGVTLEVTPLVHNVLNDRFSAVTFTTVPDNYPGLYLVDRTNQTITDQLAFETRGIRINNDLLPLRATVPWGAFLMGGLLLLATRDRNFDDTAESYIGGTFSSFVWNGDGTATPVEGELGLETILTNGYQPTLFLPGEEPNTARLLNNGFFRDGMTATGANFDYIYADADGHAQVDSTRNITMENVTLEPLKHFSFNADRSSTLLAGKPHGAEEAKLYVAGGLHLSEGLNVGADPVVSALWYSQGETDRAFVTNSGSNIFGVAIENDRPVTLSTSLPLYGTPSVSAFKASESSCMIYQGLVLNEARKQSAITALQCDALQGLN